MISKFQENLNVFNIYALEWTDSYIKWLFNGRVLHTFHTKKGFENKTNPFTNPLLLRIHLSIGGSFEGKEYFSGQVLNKNDAQNWTCSLLILDYIRVYQNRTDGSNSEAQFVTNKITSSEVCDIIMPDIKPKNYTSKLIFSNEFTDQSFDQKKWDIHKSNSPCKLYA